MNGSLDQPCLRATEDYSITLFGKTKIHNEHRISVTGGLFLPAKRVHQVSDRKNAFDSYQPFDHVRKTKLSLVCAGKS